MTTETEDTPANGTPTATVKAARQHFTLAERLARMNPTTFAKARQAHADEAVAFTAEVERRKAAAAAL